MENKHYPTIVLAKDQLKRNVTNHQIHDIVFKIVLEIDRICRKNDIHYALAFGSALGLVHYKNFIPWDDDADIAIDYFDLPRFIKALQTDLSDDFCFDCYEVDNRYNVLIPTIKVRYKRSNIVEKTNVFLPNRCHNGNGIFVDVVTFMGVPENNKEHKKLLRKSKIKMPFMCILDAIFHINPKRDKAKLKEFEKEVANKYKDSSRVSQTIIIPFQDHPKKMVKEISFSREIIYPFREYEFRNHKLYSFNKVEEFALLRYGEFKPNYQHKSDHLKKVDIY